MILRSSPGAFQIVAGLVALACQGVPAIAEDRPAAPRVVAAWPAGPLEVRVAFDSPADPAVAQAMVGRTIPYGERDPKKPGPRLAVTLGRLRIAAGRLDDGGRTLILTTDPHPRQATYVLTVPVDDSAGRSTPQGGVPLSYDLGGAEVSWTDAREESKSAWSGWWPQVDPSTVRALAQGSVEHERSLACLARPGRLEVRTLLVLPEGKVTVRLESGAPLEATLGADPPGSQTGGDANGRHRAEWTLESTGDPIELVVTIPTGMGGRPLDLRASFQGAGDPTERPIPAERQVVGWAPPSTPVSASPPPLPAAMAGGDAVRGEAIFRGDEAKCSSCHKVGGKGGDVGPALDDLADRDPATVYRDIAEPSAVIDPEYLPYTVALKDGRVAAGVVHAEGADAIRVDDVNGRGTTIPRAEIEELRPGSTSVMPVGLVGALGEARMRDLLAFLTASRQDAPGSHRGPAGAVAAGGTPAAALRGVPAAGLPRLATEVAFPGLRFERPVAMAYPDDGGNLLFVAEQGGRIWSFPDEPGAAEKVEFLDIRPKVFGPASGGHNEEGLLGLAFHPDYRRNGEFFVYYSSHEGPTGRRSIVSRMKVSRDDPRRADPASEQRIWIGPPDPYGNHNGGMIAFGPDRYLYITLGDSGAADDPLTTGQDPSDWFGSILRIDVDHPGDGKPYGIPRDNPRLRDPQRFAAWAPEVYCIGLRNVWKFSFDRETGTLWAGEVGQNLWEIVHIIENGGNYGWSIKEGFHSFRPRQRKDPASPLSPPLAEYPHAPNQGGSGRMDDGKSITGGYVYRGRDLPELAGIYVYGDYDTGRIWGLRARDGKAVAGGELIDRGRGPKLNIASFGEDRRGELFILAFDGRIHRLVRRP